MFLYHVGQFELKSDGFLEDFKSGIPGINPNLQCLFWVAGWWWVPTLYNFTEEQSAVKEALWQWFNWIIQPFRPIKWKGIVTFSLVQ
jgi:hypothetical protein